MLKSNEQRIIEMHRRASNIEQNDKQLKVKLYYICAAVTTAAAMFFIVFILPGMSGNSELSGSFSGMYGSVFGEGNALNYIVVGILAFVLGVALTIFCYKLNKWQKEKTHNEDQK